MRRLHALRKPLNAAHADGRYRGCGCRYQGKSAERVYRSAVRLGLVLVDRCHVYAMPTATGKANITGYSHPRTNVKCPRTLSVMISTIHPRRIQATPPNAANPSHSPMLSY